MSVSSEVRDLMIIEWYIRINFYDKFRKSEARNRNIIVANGIIKVIYTFCKPLLLTMMENAIGNSVYTWTPESYRFKKHYVVQPLPTIKSYMKDGNCKIVLVGAKGIGKTSLLITYTTNAFPTQYIPTVFDNYTTDIKVRGKTFYIGLWDTAGGSEFGPGLRPLSYPQTDVFMVCMSIYDDKLSTKNKAEMWTQSAKDAQAFCQELDKFSPGIPRILVGTKTDLRSDDKCKSDCYTKEEMELFAKIWHCDGYIECSALKDDMTNIQATFNYVITKAIQFRQHLSNSKQCNIL